MGASRRVFSPRVIVCTMVSALVCALLLLALAPVQAYARSYQISQVDIDASISDDGTLTVTEVRTFDFDGHFNGVYWEIPEGRYEGRNVEVDILYGGEVVDGSVTLYDLSDSEQNHTYQVSDYSGGKRVKIFSQHDDESVQFVISYQVTGGVSRWADTSELYWKYVSDGWDEESQNVTMLLHLPVPAGASVNAGDNVRAWGHGPLDGSVSFNDDEIVFFSPGVGTEEYAEARVTFPADWLPGLGQSSQSRLQQVLREEEQWANEANEQRHRARAMTGGALGVGIAAIAATLFAIIRTRVSYARASRALFQDKYYRDVPTSDHPAVLGALYNDGSVNDEALTATLMRLTDIGLVRLERTRLTRKRLLGKKEVDDYKLTYTGTVKPGVYETDDWQASHDAERIDRETIDFLFRMVARREYEIIGDAGEGEFPPLYFSVMEDVAKKHAESYDNAYGAWRGAVEGAYASRFASGEDKPATRRGPLFAAFVIDIFVGIAFMFCALVFELNIAVTIAVFVTLVLVAIAAMVCAVTMTELNREGIETKAKLKALRNWLKDFTHLSEAIPQDVVLWNRLLVMAAALGVADEVVEQLRVAMPHILEDPYMRSSYGWWYYYGSDRSTRPASMLASSAAAAHHVSAAQIASSSDSSGGGGGGGFSGGGGGGFGGGGGGGAF